MTSPRASFPRGARIRSHADFVRIQGKPGARVPSRSFLVLLSARDDGGPSRLGLVVSKRVGNAVHRNRAKRLIREAFRRNRAVFGGDVDAVIIAHPPLASLTLLQVERELIGLRMEIAKRIEGLARAAREAQAPGDRRRSPPGDFAREK